MFDISTVLKCVNVCLALVNHSFLQDTQEATANAAFVHGGRVAANTSAATSVDAPTTTVHFTTASVDVTAAPDIAIT